MIRMEDDVIAEWALPVDILTKLLQKITPKTAARCSCVAKTWKLAAESPILKQRIAQEQCLRFGDTEPTILWEGNANFHVYCVARRCNLIALGGEEQIKIWDMEEASMVHFSALEGRQITTLCFIDGLLFSGDSDGHLIGWDVETNDQIIDVKTHTRLVQAIVDLEDSIACGGGYNTDVKVISKEGWTRGNPSERALQGHTMNVECLVGVPKHNLLVSGSGDSTIRLWNTDSWECLTVLSGHGAAVLSLYKQGNLLLSGSLDSRVHLWDLDALGYYRSLNTSRMVAAISVKGSKVVSGSDLGHIRVWDMEEMICLRSFKVGMDTRGLWLDEGKLLGVSGDGHIYAWDFSS
ncbi:hypothetical protein BSKO_05645 [Bryopsis sp. KO-2023]|nr:hypothetical protein BSKO_05645 [Bryopsis sp. KO-2023]